MRKMQECIIYLLFTGIISFVLGRILPKSWFKEAILFRSFMFEKEGKLYKKIGIHKWQNRVPDMSRIFKNIMPVKKMDKDVREKLPDMIRETCVAELIHVLLCFSGLYCIRIWNGTGGKIIAILNVLGNIPFILIQRYNRPRFLCLLRKLKEGKRKNACIDIEL